MPEVPAPFLAKIDPAVVAAMGLADGAGQAFLGLWHGDQVHVIGHQAPRPDFHPALAAPFGHQFKIGEVIVIAEKSLLTAVATLSDVMRVARSYDARDSGHVKTIAGGMEMSEMNILSPKLAIYCPRNSPKDEYTVPGTRLSPELACPRNSPKMKEFRARPLRCRSFQGLRHEGSGVPLFPRTAVDADNLHPFSPFNAVDSRSVH